MTAFAPTESPANSHLPSRSASIVSFSAIIIIAAICGVVLSSVTAHSASDRIFGGASSHFISEISDLRSFFSVAFSRSLPDLKQLLFAMLCGFTYISRLGCSALLLFRGLRFGYSAAFLIQFGSAGFAFLSVFLLFQIFSSVCVILLCSRAEEFSSRFMPDSITGRHTIRAKTVILHLSGFFVLCGAVCITRMLETLLYML